MSTNIQVPNYQQTQPAQSYQQGVQSVQPNHMGGNYNPHQQNVQNVQNVQQVHYDNYNQIIQPVEENTSKSVTFIADAISLDVMKDCDNIHINTLINMGIRLAKEHNFYKQFLVNKDNYNLKGTNVDYDEISTNNTNNANMVNSVNSVSSVPLNTQKAPVDNVVNVAQTVTVPATNNDLDFSKLFTN